MKVGFKDSGSVVDGDARSLASRGLDISASGLGSTSPDPEHGKYTLRYVWLRKKTISLYYIIKIVCVISILKLKVLK